MPECTVRGELFGSVGRRRIDVGFDGGDVTSDGGLLLIRKADQQIGLLDRVAAILPDPRDPARIPPCVRVLVASIESETLGAIARWRNGTIREGDEGSSGGEVAVPPESLAIEALSQEVGISVTTLERWRSEALTRPARERAWLAAARLEAVVATAVLDEAGQNAWCREHGVYPSELERFR